MHFLHVGYGKGGSSAESFLIQEGVPTSLVDNSFVFEPVGYTIGGKKSFWFFRANSQKNEIENLNSPSSKFIQFENIKTEFINSKHLEWYELVSKLSFVAMGNENSP